MTALMIPVTATTGTTPATDKPERNLKPEGGASAAHHWHCRTQRKTLTHPCGRTAWEGEQTAAAQQGLGRESGSNPSQGHPGQPP